MFNTIKEKALQSGLAWTNSVGKDAIILHSSKIRFENTHSIHNKRSSFWSERLIYKWEDLQVDNEKVGSRLSS